MANYMLIGAQELGSTIFTVENGKMTVNLTEDVARRLWDNYYVPFVKGWFAGEGRFRSDDISRPAMCWPMWAPTPAPPFSPSRCR